MTRVELNQFLHQYTEVEKVLCGVIQEDFPTEYGETVSGNSRIMNRYFLPRNEILEIYKNYLENPENYYTLNEKMFVPPGERIAFFIHPRIMNLAGISPEHRHSFIELIYVYSGQCIQTIEGVKMTLQEGDICILDTNVAHSVSIGSRDDIIINCLMCRNYFDTAFLGRLTGNNVMSDFFIRAIYKDKSLNNYIHFHSRQNEEVRQIMDHILCEYYDNRMCSDEVISAYIIILFSELLRIYKKEANSLNYSELRHTKISDVILYLQQNYKDATLATTACHFNFHPTYLSQVFKKLTGTGFKDYLQQAKLERACTLLISTDFTIDEIVRTIGYSNMNFFYKLFRNRYGMTPHEYRKNQGYGLFSK